MNPINIYHRLPVFMQNYILTSYGYLLKRQRYGGDFKRYCRELDEGQWFSSELLNEIQGRKLREIIDHAYLNVPYYRKIMASAGVSPQDIKDADDLNKIPVLDKQALKANKEEFVAKNISKRDLIPYLTGGTTGTPLTLYVTKNALRYNFACGETRCKHWAKVKSGDRLATFLGKPVVAPETKNPPFWRRNYAYNQILFSSFHMNDKNLKYYTEEYNRFRPKVVQGYVSIIYRFAKYVLDKKLRIFSPQAVLVSSETLFEHQKETIAKAFGSRVYNGYSLAELVAFITECEEGRLHISPEYGVLEFKKISGAERKYEIIATGLFNLAMPLIRYRTGDVLTLSEEKECPCGRKLPLVKSIEGRTDSMLITPEGYYISPASLSLIFQAARNIKESQIVQVRKDKVIVRIVKGEMFSQRDAEYLIGQFKERLGPTISVDLEFPAEIERTAAGKFKFVISEILSGNF